MLAQRANQPVIGTLPDQPVTLCCGLERTALQAAVHRVGIVAALSARPQPIIGDPVRNRLTNAQPPGFIAYQLAEVTGQAETAVGVAHVQRSMPVVHHLNRVQCALQLQRIHALAAQNDVVAATVTKGVVAVAALQKIIAAPALNQVIAVAADDERAAGVRLRMAVEVLHPGRFPRRAGQIGDHEGRVFMGQVIKRRIKEAVQAVAIAAGQMADPGRDIDDGERQHIPHRGRVMVVEAHDIVGRRRQRRVVYAQ